MTDERKEPQRPLFHAWDRDPDRHRPVDGDYVQRKRVRLHRPGPWRTFFVVGLAFTSVWFSVAAIVAVTVARGALTRSLVAVVVAVPVVLLVWATSRALAVGLYATDATLRQNRVLTALEVDWTDVADVRRVAEPVPFLGIGPRVAGERVYIVLSDGNDLRTTLTTRSPDFLLRAEAYDVAALAVETWWSRGRDTT